MAAPKINYTSRDFETIKLALRTHLQAKFPDTWRDFYESQMGVAWLELVAYSFDILSFYLDYQANEQFLPTARDRLSVVNICKLLGYNVRPATSAAVVVTGTLPAVQAQNVVVPAGTTLVSTTGVTFRVLADQVITAGLTSGNITFTEGELKTDSFVSDGSRFQRFKLTDPDTIDGSIAVQVSSNEWDKVDSLVFASGSDQVFAAWYDEDSHGYIEFGDGTSGAIPPNAATIDVSYRSGGGVAGNIGLSELQGTVQGYLLGLTPTVWLNVTVLNDEQRGSGGEERETIDHVKYWAPKWVATNGRAVSEYDFDTLAVAFSDPTYGAVAYAKAKLHQEIPEFNLVDIHVWGRDSEGNLTTASVGLKTALEAYFMNNSSGAIRIICTDVDVLDGDLVYIDIDVTVNIDSAHVASAIITDVGTALTALFASSVVQPGEAFRLSHAYDAIQDVAGVEHALINEVTASGADTETIGVGDGADATFNWSLDVTPNLPIVPGTVTVTASSQVLTDNGSGVFTGAGTGTIDYDTGVLAVAFDAAPAAGVSITCEFRAVLDYQRNELEFTSTGSTAVEDVVDYPPVVAYDPISGRKGIAFSDGNQTVYDRDGDGRLYDQDDILVGSINYAAGSYAFTWSVAPSVGASIWSAYCQKLQTSSEDIPILKTQLCRSGTFTVVTEE